MSPPGRGLFATPPNARGEQPFGAAVGAEDLAGLPEPRSAGANPPRSGVDRRDLAHDPLAERGRSSGLRLVVMFASVTTCSSTTFAPALRRSVRMLGNDVSVPVAHDVGLDERPRPVADRGDRLAGADEVAHERDGVVVHPQPVGVARAAGQQQRVVVVDRCVGDRAGRPRTCRPARGRCSSPGSRRLRSTAARFRRRRPRRPGAAARARPARRRRWRGSRSCGPQARSPCESPSSSGTSKHRRPRAVHPWDRPIAAFANVGFAPSGAAARRLATSMRAVNVTLPDGTELELADGATGADAAAAIGAGPRARRARRAPERRGPRPRAAARRRASRWRSSRRRSDGGARPHPPRRRARARRGGDGALPGREDLDRPADRATASTTTSSSPRA